jgi:diaminohydroxyphosphoribosylaminopyrimidine deaminase/5-amino-6-(5-phosphoribosylamino)uracil reductase
MAEKSNIDEIFMQRACDLARLGGAKVSPNPMVGAVIVVDNRIIGEGFHKAYGSPHAEVNAVDDVKVKHRHLLKKSTIYVSLEPCCIQGKTPPCTDLIINQEIPRVVISAIDKSPEVNGKSVQLLQQANVDVTQDVLAHKGEAISQPRATFVDQKRPYVILKYARSKDGFMASRKSRQVWISNAYTSRLTHKWRSEVNAIMIGTHTARIDNPSLTTRYYFGNNATRVVLDRNLSLKQDLNIFDDQANTIVFNDVNNEKKDSLTKVKINFDQDVLTQVLSVLFEKNIATLMVEGGPTLLESFYRSGLWDEARIITGEIEMKEGIIAPDPHGDPDKSFTLGSDQIAIFYR